MKMTIPYNITGKQRKQLAEDISVALHTIPSTWAIPPATTKSETALWRGTGS
jgi:hypothetical protein